MNRKPANFARVYNEHVFIVYGYLAYRLQDRETAQDLTQATFERALRSWSRFDPRLGSERTWLMAIARNLLIDHHRSRRRQSLALLDEPGEATVLGADEQFLGSPELEQALSQLSDRERDVVALRYGGDFSGKETAALLGLTLANVQQIDSRALRKLRQLLGEHYRAPSPSSAPTATSARPANSQAETSSRSLSGRGP